MRIGIFSDPTLQNLISRDGAFSNPDRVLLDGEAGETEESQLYLANVQSQLTGGMTDSSVNVLVANNDFFQIGDILKIDSEKMLITSGSGTSFTVQRAYNGTTPTSHVPGAIVFAAYDYSNITLTIHDSQAPSSANWITLASSQLGLDAATPGNPLVIADKTYNQTISFWRRVTIPPNTPTGLKSSLSLRLSRVEHEAA